MQRDYSSFAPFLLRVGLGAVMIWFGYQQLMYGQAWTIWVPEWTTFTGLEPARIVMLNGLFEVAAGILLVAGIFVRTVALLLFLHLSVIIIDIGLTPIGVRDVGIAIGLLALVLLGPGTYALMRDTRHDNIS